MVSSLVKLGSMGAPFSLLRTSRLRIVALVTRICVCVAVLLSLAYSAVAFDWTLIKHDGRDYVPV